MARDPRLKSPLISAGTFLQGRKRKDPGTISPRVAPAPALTRPDLSVDPVSRAAGPSITSFLGDPGGRALLARIGQAIGPPGSTGARISGAAAGLAGEEQFRNLIGRMEGGDFTAPTGVSGVGVTPEMINQAMSQVLNQTRTEAFASQVEKIETPEQRLSRELQVAALRTSKGPTPGTFEVNVGPDGKQTSARDRHLWRKNPDGSVDYETKDETGRPVNYIGPKTGATPAGGDPRVQQRQWYQQAVREVMQSPELSAFGKLVQDTTTGELKIQWTNEVAGRRELNRLLADRIRTFQEQDLLPTPFLGIDTTTSPTNRPKVEF